MKIETKHSIGILKNLILINVEGKAFLLKQKIICNPLVLETCKSSWVTK